jgi:hypothetical protein
MNRLRIGSAIAGFVLALLSVAIYDATVAAWDSKYTYNRSRPSVAEVVSRFGVPPSAGIT